MPYSSNDFQHIEKILVTSVDNLVDNLFTDTVKIASRSDKNCSRSTASRLEKYSFFAFLAICSL